MLKGTKPALKAPPPLRAPDAVEMRDGRRGARAGGSGIEAHSHNAQRLAVARDIPLIDELRLIEIPGLLSLKGRIVKERQNGTGLQLRVSWPERNVDLAGAPGHQFSRQDRRLVAEGGVLSGFWEIYKKAYLQQKVNFTGRCSSGGIPLTVKQQKKISYSKLPEGLCQ